MTEIADSLRLLFETSLEKEGDRYVVQIPEELVEDGTLSVDEQYRVALHAIGNATGQTTQQPAETDIRENGGHTSAGVRTRSEQTPPVDEGEVRTVTIDTIGDQGDGIAKVERGFIVIVPETRPGDRLEVEVTDVKDTVAFAEPVSEPTVQ